MSPNRIVAVVLVLAVALAFVAGQPAGIEACARPYAELPLWLGFVLLVFGRRPPGRTRPEETRPEA